MWKAALIFLSKHQLKNISILLIKSNLPGGNQIDRPVVFQKMSLRKTR